MSYTFQEEHQTPKNENPSAEKPVARLNQLMQQNLDTVESYRAGAKFVEVSSLKKMMNYLARQHAGFSSDVRTEVIRLGGKPIDKPSQNPAFFEGWMQAKDAFAENTEEAMLKACRVREEKTLENYLSVLRSNVLGERATSLLRAHRHRIQDALAHLSELESKYHWMD